MVAACLSAGFIVGFQQYLALRKGFPTVVDTIIIVLTTGSGLSLPQMENYAQPYDHFCEFYMFLGK